MYRTLVHNLQTLKAGVTKAIATIDSTEDTLQNTLVENEYHLDVARATKGSFPSKKFTELHEHVN